MPRSRGHLRAPTRPPRDGVAGAVTIAGIAAAEDAGPVPVGISPAVPEPGFVRQAPAARAAAGAAMRGPRRGIIATYPSWRRGRPLAAGTGPGPRCGPGATPVAGYLIDLSRVVNGVTYLEVLNSAGPGTGFTLPIPVRGSIKYHLTVTAYDASGDLGAPDSQSLNFTGP
jgi:hypothetical protein